MSTADRHKFLELLSQWWEAPDLARGSTLRLGDRHSGNSQSPAVIARLSRPAKPRRHGDAVLSLPQDISRALRARPVAFTKQYAEVANLTPLPGVTGLDKNSQVYRGTLGTPADVSESRAHAAHDAVDVIVKIYQTSRIEMDAWDFFAGEEVNRVALATNVLQDFELEIWAYNQLAPLQGSVVPYVYGFFRVVLPHGEPCIALVEEYIPTIKWKDFKRLIRHDPVDTLRTVGENLSNAVHALHTCGVFQRDLAGRNALLPVDDPTLPVLIDFAHVSLAQAVDPFMAVWPIISTLIDIGFGKEAVKEWARDKIRNNKSWVFGFDVPADDCEYLNAFVFDGARGS